MTLVIFRVLPLFLYLAISTGQPTSPDRERPSVSPVDVDEAQQKFNNGSTDLNITASQRQETPPSDEVALMQTPLPVAEGNRVTLRCFVTTSHSGVVWYKNGKLETITSTTKTTENDITGTRPKSEDQTTEESSESTFPSDSDSNFSTPNTITAAPTHRWTDPTTDPQPIFPANSTHSFVAKRLNFNEEWCCAVRRRVDANASTPLAFSPTLLLNVTWPPTLDHFERRRIDPDRFSLLFYLSGNPMDGVDEGVLTSPTTTLNVTIEKRTLPITIIFATASSRAAPFNVTVRVAGRTLGVVVIDDEDDETTTATPGGGDSGTKAAATAIWAIIVVLIVVVAVLAFLRWRRKEQDQRLRVFLENRVRANLVESASSRTSFSLSTPKQLVKRRQSQNHAVNVDEFFASFLKKHGAAFRVEFNALAKTKGEGLVEQAERETNADRNRYQDILPYDESRVNLIVEADDHDDIDALQSDYINANFIDGFRGENAFIASQGPLTRTLDHFWRMIWQEKVNFIVMLANLFEDKRKKVERYWPIKVGDATFYGKVKVIFEEEEVFANFVLRRFSVKKGRGENRSLKQIQFTTWPDHGVPTLPIGMSSFVTLVRSMQKDEADSPILVHCSAGVGRTGTFIAIWNLIDESEEQMTVDVYRCVEQMRRKRMKMVQNLEQYKFIHETFVMLCTPELKEVHVKDVDAAEKCSLVADETFNILERWRMKISRNSTTSVSYKHRSKSRFRQGPFPSDKSLVRLENPQFDFLVHACYVDSYCMKENYVATQAPLSGSVGDFWKLVWDQGIGVIVMLNSEGETAPPYWRPASCAGEQMAPLRLEFIAESTSGHVTSVDLKLRVVDASKEFRIDDQPDSEDVRTVTLLQMMDWPEESYVPNHTASTIAIFERIRSRRQRTAVHCLDGAKKTGLFLACCNLLEKAVVHQSLHVAWAALSVRESNPNFVVDASQLQFLVDVSKAHLAGVAGVTVAGAVGGVGEVGVAGAVC